LFSLGRKGSYFAAKSGGKIERLEDERLVLRWIRLLHAVLPIRGYLRTRVSADIVFGNRSVAREARAS
jgi:hypothetical protein